MKLKQNILEYLLLINVTLFVDTSKNIWKHSINFFQVTYLQRKWEEWDWRIWVFQLSMLNLFEYWNEHNKATRDSVAKQ